METFNDWYNFIMECLIILWILTAVACGLMLIGGGIYYFIKGLLF